MEDEKIIELYWDRLPEAVEQTELRYGNYARKIASNILADTRDVDECVNDTYLKLWNSIPPSRPDNLRLYLGRIVRNLSINMYRGQHTQKRYSGGYLKTYEELEEMLSGEAAADIAIDEVLLADLINGYLAGISAEKRMMFVGRYWYFETVKEISGKLGLSESKVKISLLRMRKSLRHYLEEEGVSL